MKVFVAGRIARKLFQHAHASIGFQDVYKRQEDGGVTVAIDTELTEALIEEGFLRELVSKFQTMRKEAGFHVEDHIRACL